jgi:L-idonate 5-dehydrogenase
MMVPTRAIIARGARDLSVGEVAVADLGSSDVLVRISTGGICGSDLHYYQHGGFGTVRIRAPLVLGHELAGTIMACGSEVREFKPGDRVAVNPSLACGTCAYCRVGLQNHCQDMRFMGSAMRSPHVQGGFRDLLVCSASQAHKVPDHLSFGQAALAEPTAVCLHALSRAGDLVGKRVLITGAGPIGLLMVAVCRLAGAAQIVITDRLANPLEVAKATGADAAINVVDAADGLASWTERNGRFGVHFEASGSGSALIDGISALAPRGISVLIGQGAEVPLQISNLIGREIEMRGSFRFDREFGVALDHLANSRLSVSHLITATLPASQAVRAFDLALDKQASVKVQLDFT